MNNKPYYGRLDQRRINELNGVLRHLKGKLKKMNEALNPLYHLFSGKINEEGISVELWKYDEVDSWIMDFVTGWWWSHLTQLPTASGLQRFCDEIWENIPAEYKERDWKQIQPHTNKKTMETTTTIKFNHVDDDELLRIVDEAIERKKNERQLAFRLGLRNEARYYIEPTSNGGFYVYDLKPTHVAVPPNFISEMQGNW